MSRRSLRLFCPAALLLLVVATDAAAKPNVARKVAGNAGIRNYSSRVAIRDHRISSKPITKAPLVLREHRTLPIVRDHQKLATPIQPNVPIIRDHRTPRIPLPTSVGPIKPRLPVTPPIVVPVKPPVIGPIKPPVIPPLNPPIRPPFHPLPPIHPPVHPLPPIDPGIGNGDAGHCFPDRPWCGTRPAHCWWWFDYCRPLRICPPDAYVSCSYSIVQCAPVVVGDVVTPATRWYLGLSGLVLPGKGLGVEAVEAGSPAELAGLRPGMVIVKCNGVALVDEATVADTIASSGGTLRLEILQAEGAEPAVVSVAMKRVAAVSF
jgi:hypothetical protein